MAKRGLRVARTSGEKSGFRAGHKAGRIFEICTRIACFRGNGIYRCGARRVHAQVGERLKPTDCKSVGLKVYEGSNPSLCTIFRRFGAF